MSVNSIFKNEFISKLLNSQIVKSETICLTGLFLFLRLPWIFMLPMQEAPDEFAHYWVIRFITMHMSLPQATDVTAGGASAVYGSLPQLGYLPHILTSLLAPEQFYVNAARFGSLIMGLFMLFAAKKIGNIIFAENKFLALALPIAICVHPQLIFLHSYSNNDSSSSSIASILLYLGLDSLKNGLTIKRSFIIGILVGWLAITKYSGLALLPVLALLLISASIINKSKLKLIFACFFSITLPALIISSSWFIRNAHEYPGDFMGTKTMYKNWAITFHREMNYYLPPSHIIKDLRWWRMMFFSFWGLFGYMNKYIWRPVYWVYFAYLILAFSGGIKYLFCSIKQAKQVKSVNFTCFSNFKLYAWSSFILLIIINLTSMIWASVYNLGGPQGRYLFTSEIPIMALYIAGLNQIFPRKSQIIISSFLAFSFCVSIASFIYLFHSYGGWHIESY